MQSSYLKGPFRPFFIPQVSYMKPSSNTQQLLLQVRVRIRGERKPGDSLYRRMTLELDFGKSTGYYAAHIGKLTGWGMAHAGMFDRYHGDAEVLVVNRKTLSREQLVFADELLAQFDDNVDTVTLKKKMITKFQYHYDPYKLTLKMQLVESVPNLKLIME